MTPPLLSTGIQWCSATAGTAYLKSWVQTKLLERTYTFTNHFRLLLFLTGTLPTVELLVKCLYSLIKKKAEKRTQFLSGCRVCGNTLPHQPPTPRHPPPSNPHFEQVNQAVPQTAPSTRPTPSPHSYCKCACYIWQRLQPPEQRYPVLLVYTFLMTLVPAYCGGMGNVYSICHKV